MEQQGTVDFSQVASPNLGSLRPIVAQRTARYDVTNKVQRSNCTIEPGKFLSILPTYLPPQWSGSVHPEGKVYFYRNTGLRVVTESHLYNSVVAENISAWVTEVEEQASKKGFVFTDYTELFLQLEGDDCYYYFVDHDVRTLFWLDAYNTSELGFLPVVSSLHLRNLLESQYWTHIAKFCMHIDGLPLKTIDDPINTPFHALLGHQERSIRPQGLPLNSTSSDFIAQREGGNLEADIQNDNPRNAHIFSNAHNISIQDTAIHNVGGDMTIIHNHYTYYNSELSPLNVLSQWSSLSSGTKSHMIVLPSGFVMTPEIYSDAKVAEDALKYLPLKYSNAKILLSKTSMRMPGFVAQTLISARYSFFA